MNTVEATYALSWVGSPLKIQVYPAGPRPKNNVIMTSKRRHDVVLTSSWR